MPSRKPIAAAIPPSPISPGQVAAQPRNVRTGLSCYPLAGTTAACPAAKLASSPGNRSSSFPTGRLPALRNAERLHAPKDGSIVDVVLEARHDLPICRSLASLLHIALSDLLGSGHLEFRIRLDHFCPASDPHSFPLSPPPLPHPPS